MASACIAPLRLALTNVALARGAVTWGAWVASEAATLVVVSIVVFGEGGVAAVGIAGAARVLPAAIATVWARSSSIGIHALSCWQACTF